MQYNSFKKQVYELTATCVFDYNTVYRLSSILGIEKAKEIINIGSKDVIQYILMRFVLFPDEVIDEEVARMTLKSIDPALLELFESLLVSSGYNFEVLYSVFMSHGSEAKDIVEYAKENKLMPFQLFNYSDKKLSEGAGEALKKFREFEKSTRKKEKLPKKLRNGWS